MDIKYITKTCCRKDVHSSQSPQQAVIPWRGLYSCCRKKPSKGGCGCQGVTYWQQKYLEFLWKIDERNERHKKTCKCCDICCQIRLCSGNEEHTACPCTTSGHRNHIFCYATDHNILVARVEILRYNIRQSIKWLLVNIAALSTFSNYDGIPALVQWALTIICSLNMCFYLINLCKLKVAVMKILLESPSNKSKNCLWEKNLPGEVIRYFENASDEFFCRYWQRFSLLMSIMRTVFSSPLGRTALVRGMEEELCTMGVMIEARQQNERAAKVQMEDSKYRLPLLKRRIEAVSNPLQLAKYWRDYNSAVQDEQVRLSKPKYPFQPNTKCSSSNVNSSHTERIVDKYGVTIAPVIWCLEYQYSCEHDVHPSPAVSSTSPSLRNFFDFMKIHHEKDHCSSLHWIANLKYWISVKMKEVVDQFEIANHLLRSLGSRNIQIGFSSTADLQQAFSSHEELATFLPLLGFLTLTHNQSYLVWRYRVLVRRPCLQDYSWNSGGSARQWTQETGPCDSEIVLHFFCSYMDMKLPDLPFHLTRRRPFSGTFVVLSPEPHLMRNLAIIRQWVFPPHFNVIVNGKVIQMPGGSNNLFLSLSYLIYCIKIYAQGKVGGVDLGKLGLNMLWIVGDNKI